MRCVQMSFMRDLKQSSRRASSALMKRYIVFVLLALLTFLTTTCNRVGTTADAIPRTAASPAGGARSEATPRALPEQRRGTFTPPKGFVPDERTAISIAVAVWTPIYGKEQIDSEKPFKASLKGGVWTVTGTLPEGFDGGTAIAEISQESGCILRVIHEQ